MNLLTLILVLLFVTEFETKKAFKKQRRYLVAADAMLSRRDNFDDTLSNIYGRRYPVAADAMLNRRKNLDDTLSNIDNSSIIITRRHIKLKQNNTQTTAANDSGKQFRAHNHKESKEKTINRMEDDRDLTENYDFGGEKFGNDLRSVGTRYGGCDCTEKSVKKSSCLSETQKEVIKCIRACNRAHEDVCDRLHCSDKAVRGLTKECEFYCNKVFDPKICYRRFG